MPIRKTADVCDEHPDEVQLLEPALALRDWGGVVTFEGRVRTVKVHEDNSLVRKLLEADGSGQVLVVDGGGSLRRALLGDQLAKLAVDRGWSGLVIYGAVRDAAELRGLKLGVKALGTCPVKSLKRNEGQLDVELRFGGVSWRPGQYLYADADGVVVSEAPLP